MRVSALVLCALLLACAKGPAPVSSAPAGLTPSDEDKLGAQAATLVRREIGLWGEGELSRYVETLGRSLASVAPGRPQRYSFEILDTEEPNAFALPGGFVFVTRGLLALMRTEDELAGVLGHEIGHVAAAHAAQRSSAALPVQLLATILAAPIGVIDDDTAADFVESARRLLVSPYTRAQEREADRIAAAIIASLGYEATALADALERLAAARPYFGHAGDERRGYHPPTPERIAVLRQLAGILEKGAPLFVRAEPEAFLALLDGLSLGPSLAQGRFIGRRYLAPKLGVALDFPEGWTTQLSPAGAFALSPDGRAFLQIFDLGADDDDAALAAARSLEGARLHVLEPIAAADGRRISRAYALLPGEPATLVRFWWLEAGGRRLQLAGNWSPDHDPTWAPVAEGAARSTTALAAGDLAEVRVDRLRIVQAAAGNESLAQLGARLGSSWSPGGLGLLNGRDPDTPLAPGTSAKIVLSEPAFWAPGSPP